MSSHYRDLEKIICLLHGKPERPGWDLVSLADGSIVTIATADDHTTEWMSCPEEDMVVAEDFDVTGGNE